MANFILNEIKRIIPRDPPWITKPVKTMLNRNNRFFKNYKRHGYKLEDKVRIDNIRKECQEAVETAKLTYLANMGKNVMNKCKAPEIPRCLLITLLFLIIEKKPNVSQFFFHGNVNL